MKLRREQVAWAFYDWANSAFATTVMAGFFPIFFKQHWSTGSAAESTFQLGMANSLASLAIMLSAPFLGALADQGGNRKHFLAAFALVGIVATGALHFIAPGQWQLALLCYGLAALGLMGGNIFYDSLIVDVSRESERDFLSGFGFAIGYLGGGLLFAVNVATTQWPAWFGLESAAHAVQVSFLTVAVWWGCFAMPLFLMVREPRPMAAQPQAPAVGAALRELMTTIRSLGHLRITFLFLVAYWFYIDGVDTVIVMAIDYGVSLGLNPNSLLVALLITQFVGFPAAIAFGMLGERFGAKTGLFIAIGVYALAVLWAVQMNSEREFYALAVTIGLVQGGIQSLSRSLYSTIIPQNKAAQFFGFYNMLGKFAAVLGPAMVGGVALLTGNPRLSILSIIVLFAAGATCLYFVNVSAAREAARNLGETTT